MKKRNPGVYDLLNVVHVSLNETFVKGEEARRRWLSDASKHEFTVSSFCETNNKRDY